MTTIQSKVPVVHIGMPKTATKTLQWRIFSQHSQIFYLGRFDGEQFQGRYRQFNACRDETVFKIMNEIAYSNFRNPKIEQHREMLERYLAKHNTDSNVPVWSWESYATDSRDNRRHRAESLKKLFDTAKIIVTIRHPSKLLESAYLQQLKRDNIGAGFRPGKGPFYCTIDDWVKQDRFGDISNHLDYPETIRMYVEQFGQSNVCVMVFEDLLNNSTQFYEKLCNFMDIDSQEAITLAHQRDDNSRWTEEQLSRLASIDRSLLKSLYFRFAKRGDRKKMLGLDRSGAPLGTEKKASLSITKELSETVLERTSEGNNWLEHTFKLDLRRYGYFGL